MSNPKKSHRGSRVRICLASIQLKKLNSKGNPPADEEIYKIRDYLYQLAEIQSGHFELCPKGKTI
jgi:hypothetical protein